LINILLIKKLRNVLPPYYRECQKWKLVYSVIDHGSSITTLLNMCEETTLTGSFLLGILDTEGYVIIINNNYFFFNFIYNML